MGRIRAVSLGGEDGHNGVLMTDTGSCTHRSGGGPAGRGRAPGGGAGRRGKSGEAGRGRRAWCGAAAARRGLRESGCPAREMTLAEKFGQLEMSGPTGANGTPGQTLLDEVRNGQVGSVLDLVGVANINQVQQAALQSRLHIPAFSPWMSSMGIKRSSRCRSPRRVPGTRRRSAMKRRSRPMRRRRTGSSGPSTRWLTSAGTRAGGASSREPGRTRSWVQRSPRRRSGATRAATSAAGPQARGIPAGHPQAGTGADSHLHAGTSQPRLLQQPGTVRGRTWPVRRVRGRQLGGRPARPVHRALTTRPARQCGGPGRGPRTAGRTGHLSTGLVL